MSDRSDELRRQRDVLRDHLASVERELAAAEGHEAVPADPLSPLAGDSTDAESILAEYRRPETAITHQTKLGCVLYFVVALALVILAVAAFYFVSKASRAH